MKSKEKPATWGFDRRDSVDDLVEDAVKTYPEIDPAVEGVVDRIAKLHHYLENLWERTAEGYELNSGGYKVLLCLAQAEDGSKTPGALAKRCMVSTGAMTNRIDKLEKWGWVQRLRDTDDRRSIKVTITDTGTEVLGRAVAEQARAERDALAVFGPEELETLNGLLRELMVAFETKGDLPKDLLEH